MSFNIFPERIVKTRGDGKNFTSEVYTIDAIINGGCLSFIIVAGLIIALAPVSGFLLFILYCLTIGNRSLSMPMTMFFFSMYILIDIRKKWFLTDMIFSFYDKGGLQVASRVSLATIIVSVFATFFGWQLYKFSHKKNSIFTMFMLAIYLVCYAFASLFF